MSRPGQRALDSLREWARRHGRTVVVDSTPRGRFFEAHAWVALLRGPLIEAYAWGPDLAAVVQRVNERLRGAGLRFVRRGGAPRGNRNARAANPTQTKLRWEAA